MIISPRFKLYYIMLFHFCCVMFLVSCVSSEGQEPTTVITTEVSSMLTPTQLTNTAVVDTVSLTTPVPTHTITPTVVFSPTPTLTSVPPTTTPTITPAPTLSVQEEGVFLSTLMANNGGCDLPCWWGITPGKTNEQAARDSFASKGIDDWVSSFDGAYRLMGLGYPYSNSPYYSNDTGIQVWVDDNIIQFIDVQGRRRNDEAGYLFTEDWQQYNISKILKRFGMPEHITLIEEVPVDAGPHFYQLGLSYPSFGLEIRYIISPIILENGKEQICSNFEHVDFIRLLLYLPEQVANAPVDIIPNYLEAYTTWEEKTETTVEYFYEMFQNESESACLIVSS